LVVVVLDISGSRLPWGKQPLRFRLPGLSPVDGIFLIGEILVKLEFISTASVLQKACHEAISLDANWQQIDRSNLSDDAFNP